MKKTISRWEFIDAFDRMGRSSSFTRSSRSALFDYYEEIEEGTGEEIELDVIAVCCDWTEHGSARDAATDYGWQVPGRDDGEPLEDHEDRVEEEALEWLQKRTTVIESEDAVLILNF